MITTPVVRSNIAAGIMINHSAGQRYAVMSMNNMARQLPHVSTREYGGSEHPASHLPAFCRLNIVCRRHVELSGSSNGSRLETRASLISAVSIESCRSLLLIRALQVMRRGLREHKQAALSKPELQ